MDGDGNCSGCEYAFETTTTQPVMTDRDLRSIIRMVHAECGIALSPSKKNMATARLAKRIKTLGFSSYGEYCNFLASAEGRAKEMSTMIDYMTTNTTEFFREKKHFDFLTDRILPQMTKSVRFQRQPHLNFWSAGCSTGEEPYTIAMVMAEHFGGDFSAFSILATDISSRAMARARSAVYPDDSLESIPPVLKARYMMKGIGSQSGNYRIVPELRSCVSVSHLNLMDEEFRLPWKMDVIFCRNVIIYFDNNTNVRLISKFYDSLVPGGYFFAGHAETLSGLNSQFVPIAPTIYRKPK